LDEDKSNGDYVVESLMQKHFPLNQILFGPPGTGKTYHTINRALEIIEGKSSEEIKSEDRSELTKRFKVYQKEGRIAFCTFHQSMSYEDFVEGIKPLKPNSSGQIGYEVTDGIFKVIADRALENTISSSKENKSQGDFETVWQMLVDEWDENPEITFGMKTKGKEFVILDIHKNSIPFRKANGGEGHTLSKKNIRDVFYGNSIRATGLGIYYPGIVDKLKEIAERLPKMETALQPYVLIIDEINRGNVSQIFGELITLIEEDKRAGKPEALEVTLPYSKEPFFVPSNLYIIGTMNTADRSVEALDTALRRRFVFEEMPPKPELLSTKDMLIRFWNHDSKGEFSKEEWDIMHWDTEPFKQIASSFYQLLGIDGEQVEKPFGKEFNWDSIKVNEELDFNIVRDQLEIEVDKKKGVNLVELLTTINARIELLLSKDHQIGHSYFLNVSSEEDLKRVFYNAIIPLLQEYFYGDYGKIGLVLGSKFVAPKKDKAVLLKFDNSYDFEGLQDRVVYEILSFKNSKPGEFMDAVRSIYQSPKSNEKGDSPENSTEPSSESPK
jgi:5-methylcytosine-specific restriction protein B